ncbi:Potassium transporter [Lecanicillium sp. MT-2017a]|nr:Potassium transporter [Lecanicillium sp. MT-2017a]
MGCCGNRKKQTREFADQKWDYINLKDFKAGGCGAPFAYGYLWFSLLLSIAVYSVDSFTAVQLIAFNRWSSAIEPAISFDVSKWIFSICILLSFINLAFEAVRAIRVMKRGNVAECYMDNLAVRWESIRVGNGGQGWRRFLVFASLTKSKKGAEYIALFTYFSFKSWIRVLVCSGPRQVINAFTLKSVYEAKLSTEAHSVDKAFTGFFDRVKALAQEDARQAAILSGMAFTFVVWAFAFIFLLTAVLFYVFFLFHWIPRADGGLTGYCERKVNKALLKIVTKKVNKALAKNQAKQMKAEAKNARMYGEKPDLQRAATLPDVGLVKDDSLPEMPSLARTDTGGSLPPYASRPSSPGGIELSNLERGRPPHTRTGTMGSTYSARAPLMGAAADMGYSRTASPAPSLAHVEPGMPPQRPGTAASQRSFSQRQGLGPGPGHQYANSGASLPLSRLGSAPPMNAFSGPGGPGYGPPSGARPGFPPEGATATPTIPPIGLGHTQPPGEAMSRFGANGSPAPSMAGLSSVQQPTIPNVSGTGAFPQTLGPSNSQRSMDTFRSGGHVSSPSGSSLGAEGADYPGSMRPPRDASATPLMYGQASYNGTPGPGNEPRQQPSRQYEPYNPNARRPTPASLNNANAGGSPPRRYNTPAGQPPYQPTRSATGPVLPRGPPMQPPQRSMTGPNAMTGGGPPPDSFQRPGTAQGMQGQSEFNSTGRWIPPSQRNNPSAYDVEAQPDNGYRW